ncbi:MAG: NAD(+) diphosphatase [Xanthomonadales bacterium]|nr:NAD(+) diphosphatase [Xanthomonadales bacterium]
MTDFRTSLPLSGGALDRCDERRMDRVWLRAQWANARLYLLDVDGRMLAREDREAPLLADASRLAADWRPDADDAIFLGLDKERQAHFAVQLPGDVDLRVPAVGIREAAAMWPAAESARFAHAAALFGWRRRHRYCPQCAAPLSPRRAGNSLACEAGNGCSEQFPRTDAAVIVIVVHQGKCLLGRQASWPEGSYSALAGFVEPGESLEEAVAREVREESGVRIGEALYRGSQPWPFPHSMMIGFHAVADDPQVTLGDELEDARWFGADDLADGYAAGSLRAPAAISIAHRLLHDWLAAQPGEAAARALALLPDAARPGVRRASD